METPKESFTKTIKSTLITGSIQRYLNSNGKHDDALVKIAADKPEDKKDMLTTDQAIEEVKKSFTQSSKLSKAYSKMFHAMLINRLGKGAIPLDSGTGASLNDKERRHAIDTFYQTVAGTLVRKISSAAVNKLTSSTTKNIEIRREIVTEDPSGGKKPSFKPDPTFKPISTVVDAQSLSDSENSKKTDIKELIESVLEAAGHKLKHNLNPNMFIKASEGGSKRVYRTKNVFSEEVSEGGEKKVVNYVYTVIIVNSGDVLDRVNIGISRAALQKEIPDLVTKMILYFSGLDADQEIVKGEEVDGKSDLDSAIRSAFRGSKSSEATKLLEVIDNTSMFSPRIDQNRHDQLKRIFKLDDNAKTAAESVLDEEDILDSIIDNDVKEDKVTLKDIAVGNLDTFLLDSIRDASKNGDVRFKIEDLTSAQDGGRSTLEISLPDFEEHSKDNTDPGLIPQGQTYKVKAASLKGLKVGKTSKFKPFDMKHGKPFKITFSEQNSKDQKATMDAIKDIKLSAQEIKNLAVNMASKFVDRIKGQDRGDFIKTIGKVMYVNGYGVGSEGDLAGIISEGKRDEDVKGVSYGDAWKKRYDETQQLEEMDTDVREQWGDGALASFILSQGMHKDKGMAKNLIRILVNGFDSSSDLKNVKDLAKSKAFVNWLLTEIVRSTSGDRIWSYSTRGSSKELQSWEVHVLDQLKNGEVFKDPAIKAAWKGGINEEGGMDLPLLKSGNFLSKARDLLLDPIMNKIRSTIIDEYVKGNSVIYKLLSSVKGDLNSSIKDIHVKYEGGTSSSGKAFVGLDALIKAGLASGDVSKVLASLGAKDIEELSKDPIIGKITGLVDSVRVLGSTGPLKETDKAYKVIMKAFQKKRLYEIDNATKNILKRKLKKASMENRYAGIIRTIMSRRGYYNV